MPRKRTPRASTAGARYELVVAPVSGTTIRLPVHGAEIAALLDGGRLLFDDQGGQSYVVELVRAGGAAQHHRGRARERTAAELAPSHAEEAEVLAGDLG